MQRTPDLDLNRPPGPDIGVHVYAVRARRGRVPRRRDIYQCETRAEAILSLFACADEAIGTWDAQTGLGASMVAEESSPDSGLQGARAAAGSTRATRQWQSLSQQARHRHTGAAAAASPHSSSISRSGSRRRCTTPAACASAHSTPSNTATANTATHVIATVACGRSRAASATRRASHRGRRRRRLGTPRRRTG